MPARALTLDQAYERAYRAIREAYHALLNECGAPHHDQLMALLTVEDRLTRDLIDAGVGGTLAYQLARPPSRQ